MAIGDFTKIGSSDSDISNLLVKIEDKWDSVVTCFFIDTGHNVASCIDIIHKILKPGGVWINFGPLYYYFDGHGDNSIELSWEEIKKYIKKLFNIEVEIF